MNYPKPDILQQNIKAPATYFFVPQYSMELVCDIEFINHLSFGGSFGFLDDEFTGRSINNTASESIALLISNDTPSTKTVKLFDSYKNRTQGNNGNPTGIVITGKNQPYQEELAKSEHRLSIIGMIRINVIENPAGISNSDLFESLNFKYNIMNAWGVSPPEYKIPTKLLIDQHITTIIDIPIPSDINMELIGSSGFTIDIPANSKIEIEFYPAAISGLNPAERAAMRLNREQRKEARLNARLEKRRARRIANFTNLTNDDPDNEPLDNSFWFDNDNMME